ncbi:MAG: DUF1801 domain-containing protein [Bacteroidetes bacterium]|nr:DUF1801 domain-containing protein [Cytophagia bacterium]MBT7828434.1 DUF1801 domain-containing protein [Bacteroidota bacterium]
MNALEYILNQPLDRGEILHRLRSELFAVFPDLTESMKYNMPTYGLNGKVLFAMASKKNYLSFYVMYNDLMEIKFKEQIQKYKPGKSCLRFTKLNDSDMAFFKELIHYCGTYYKESRYYKDK